MNFFHPKRDCHLLTLGLFFNRYNLFDLNTVIILRVEMKEIRYTWISFPEVSFERGSFISSHAKMVGSSLYATPVIELILVSTACTDTVF